MQTFATQTKELLPNLAARKIFGLIKDAMSLVEAEFERQARSNIQVIDYLGDYLRSSGGKRVRPALLILANYAIGGRGSSDNVIRLATVMEMLHTATLVHDDIIDNADIRRSRTTINARFGNHAAVLMGDWLYMSAFETALKERSVEILDILTRLTRKMTEGELIQLTTIGKVDITEDEYFDILTRKTAFLFAGCCEIGAILGNASFDRQKAMREYGMNLGIAFQLADDLLDFTSDSESLGKAAAADILEGKMTLPLIKLVQKDPSIKGDLETIMLDGEYSDETRNRLMERMRSHDTLSQVREIANSYAETARKNLEILPQTEYCEALDAIPNFVIDRNN
ncbi:MAG TPA: polyprenyl synthetase family protein [Pyrinomonadaceae bacterium]|nr:polyprenyl synthetase family protein [Pyrinomonadaceae bacterium]